MANQLSENIGGVMTECLLPLRDLTAASLSVLLLHHPRKGGWPAGADAGGAGRRGAPAAAEVAVWVMAT